MERYWLDADGDELAQEMTARCTEFYDYCDGSGRLELWRRSLRQYYGLDQDGGWARSSAVVFGGEQGEIAFMSPNHYASLINEAHVLVTGSRPAFRAISSAEAHQAYEETLLAQSVLEWDLRHKRLEEILGDANLWAYVLGEGWIFQVWDPHAGEVYAVDPATGSAVPVGDVATLALQPIDVVRDPSAMHAIDEGFDWLIVRRPTNRWKLLKRHGQSEELREAIRNAPAIAEEDESRVLYTTGSRDQAAKDYVYTYELFAPPSELLPAGKYALMVGQTVLAQDDWDEPMPLHPEFAGRDQRAPFGFSPAVHLLGLQQALDSAATTALTNHDQFAGLKMWMPENSDIDVDELGAGRVVFQAATKPEVLTAPDGTGQSIALSEHIQRTMETLFGINSVQRGDPDQQLKSGAALALVQSMAVQHHSKPHAAHALMMGRVMSHRLELYHKHARTERLIEIAGDNTATVRKWRGDQLGSALKVHVEIANPMSQTSQGRKAIADEYADRGWIQSPEQHAMVMSTGRSEPMFKRDRNEMRLIGAENAKVRETARGIDPGVLAGLRAQMDERAAVTGESVKYYLEYSAAGLIPKVLPTHRHSVHVREHMAELASPEALEDESYAELLLELVQWHLDTYQDLVSSRPWLLEMIGEPIYESAVAMAQAATAPPPAPEMAEPMPPEAGGPLPDNRAQAPAAMANPTGPGAAQMPLMPMNPMTGERAAPGGTDPGAAPAAGGM